MVELLIVLAATALVIVGLPVVFYLCAKLGAYGFLRGKHLFNRDHRENGNGA